MQHFYIHATTCTHCQVLRPKNYIVSLHMKNKFMKMKILCMKMKFLAHYITKDGKIPNKIFTTKKYTAKWGLMREYFILKTWNYLPHFFRTSSVTISYNFAKWQVNMFPKKLSNSLQALLSFSQCALARHLK